MSQQENVILVNEADVQTGVMEKMEAHKQALLHRAFSVFIFNKKGEMLLQQRALQKYHSGGLWTNACCSHPRPGEDTLQAALRRLNEEMGFGTALEEIFSFTYKSPYDNGLTEYEFDHVFSGQYDDLISPDPREVSGYCFRSMEQIASDLQAFPDKYTSWFHLAFPMILKWRAGQ